MVNFYWYPKCSTCKKAKAWLDENNIAYNMIDMIETPPTKEQLVGWMEASELPVRRFFNTSGVRYREQGLKTIVNDFSNEEAAGRLCVDGMLIKRPIMEKVGEPVLLGFKEEAYEDLLK
ncbi:arsenate reductase family protein [Vagococcus intermedius]|uniref:Arsenate reductase family protein n=1 Tax=Vagococcus intermedius TaxID=2991418 RepID=A0AAF0CTZ4_9ENTE|nr:arsenate reductase family protein [Vagococcus intermedius]WEG72955.1 arsenate reductase family protein [Vagococcus intermedius]WEG75041.1 arsenate reductase family protein [Vagococcus intermedius]